MAKKNVPPLTPTETEILSHVWKLKKATVQDVCDKISVKRRIVYPTVHTLLKRLEKKGYIDPVVDFLDVFVNGHHWPAFNVADSAICIGVGLILLDAFRRPSDSEGGVPSEAEGSAPNQRAEPVPTEAEGPEEQA